MASASVALSGVPMWSEQGPGAIVDDSGGFLGAGAVVAVAAHPAEVGVIYVATSGGGVWRTRDAEINNSSPTWEPVTDLYPSSALGAIAISPLDSQVVFAGTGTFASFPSSGPAVGLYRSGDGGGTWAVLGATGLAGLRVRSLLPTSATSASGQVVLVAALSRDATTNDGGVFRSDDGGVSFTPLSVPAAGVPPPGDGWALVEDRQSGRVYAAVGGSQPGIYRYDTAGQTWTAVTGGIDATQLAAAQWIRLAVRSDRSGGPSSLVAGIVNAGQFAALYQTVALPGQEQWTPVPLPADGPAGFSPLSLAVWKFALAVAPQTGDVFVGGDEGGGIWRCGLADPAHPQWEKVSKSLDFAGRDLSQDADKVPHADVQDLVFDAAGNLLAATDGGVYRLPNPSNIPGGAARKWHAIGTGMRINEAFSVALDTLNNILTVSSADNGTSAQERTASRTWRNFLWGDGAVQAVDNDAHDFSWRYSEDGDLSTLTRWKFDKTNGQAARETVMLASSTNRTEQGSGLNGVDRKKVTNPDGSISYQYQSGNYVLNSLLGHRSRMLIGSNGLYESLDGGATIEEIILTDPTAGSAVIGVTAIAYGAMEGGVAKPNVAYVGMGGKLWLRGPGGGGFSPVNTYPGGAVVHVAMDPSDWQRAYVVDNSHVYRTTDGGQTAAAWSECTGNLLAVTGDPQGELSRVLVHRPDATAEVVLVGALGGLFRTLNPQDGPGAVWTRFGRNFPGCFGLDVHYYPRQVRGNGATGDQLVASLYGRGVWSLDHASSELVQPSVLRITGTATEQYIRLVRNADVPAQLDVHAPDGAGPTLSVPLASVQHIIVACQDGQNTLTVDCSNGPISVSGGIDYDATGSANRLVVRGGRVSTQRFRLGAGTAGSASIGEMTVRYRGVEQIDTTVHAARTVVDDIPPHEALQISDGPSLDGAQSLFIGLRRGTTQFSLNVANTEQVNVDVARGGAQVRIEDLYGAPNRLRRLVMATGPSPNDIRITTTPPGVHTEIEGGGGQDTVAVGTVTGSGGQLTDVRGPIHITNAGGKTMLSLSDADNPNATTATLTGRSLSGMAPAAITFEPASLSALTILGSKGGTDFTVETTGPYPTTVLGTGAVNALRVHGTSGPLDYTTGNGVDNIHIGAPGADGAMLTGIVGPLRLRCSPAGNINVTVDDRGDSQPRLVAVTDHTVIGLAPADIELYPSANPFLNGLTVMGGQARVFYSLVDTPPMFTLVLHGQGADVVNAYRTRQDLVVDGAAAVNVGSPTLGLASIQGVVRVGGGASTALLVDDSASSTARALTMDAASITGLTAKPIRFDAATLRAVSVRCGSGGTAVIVAGTVAAGTTQLDLGAGPDHVNVLATSGPLVIGGHAGSTHQVHVGSTGEVQKDELAPITGEIRLTGQSDTTDLIVSDAAGKLARRGQMDAADISGLAPAGIHFGPLHSLLLHLGRPGNTLVVSGTNPTGGVTVRTGGRDTIDVKASERSPCNLLIDGPSPPEADTLDVVVGAGPHVTHTPPAGLSPGTIRVSYPSGSASVIAYQNIPRIELS